MSRPFLRQTARLSLRPVKPSFQTRTITNGGKPSSSESPTAQHHDLTSFLDYAERKALDPKSTVFVGTHFEYTVAACLSRYGFSLRRTGGRLDAGIDLLGTWKVPSGSEPLRVLIQCKSGKKQLMPHHIRELEGTFIGAPPGWRGSGVLGFLATEKPATPGVRDALGRSRRPMGFITCSKEGHIQQLLWNHAAEEEGLSGMGVILRHSRSTEDPPRLVLTWQGKPIPLKR
jgi:hypothetical protein